MRLKSLRPPMHKVNKVNKWAYDLPEHSLEVFALALHKLMGATNHTQWTLSKALGVSNTTISNYLLGRRDMCAGVKATRDKMDFMRMIADELDIRPTYFLEYRIILLYEKVKDYPKLVDIFLDLASDPKKMVEWYEEFQVKKPDNRLNNTGDK